MSEHLLKLSTDQLYEVYSVMWREFVALHRQATINPYMLCEDVIERARQSRTATAQVCDMIETMRPDFVTADECYLSGRAHAQIEADK